MLAAASAIGTILDDDGSGSHVLSDNTFDSSSVTQLADSTHYLATSFKTGSNFAYLKSITLQLASIAATGNATVAIYTGTATAPQALAGTLISPNTYSANLTGTVFTTNGFILVPNTFYWVVLKPTSGKFLWSSTNSTTNAGSGYTGNWISSDDGGATWTASSTSSPLQMKVLIN